MNNHDPITINPNCSMLTPSQQHHCRYLLIMRWLKPSTHTLRKKEKCLLVSTSIYNKINKSKNQVKIYLSFKKGSNNNNKLLHNINIPKKKEKHKKMHAQSAKT